MQTTPFSDVERLQAFLDLQKVESFKEAVEIIDSFRLSMLGPGSLTINANITPLAAAGETIVLQRLWSNSPAAAVNGRKRKDPVEWTERLLRRCEIVITEGDAQIARVFDDHVELCAADVHSIINYPIVDGGRCVATLNLMSGRSSCFPEEVAIGSLIALLARPWILQATESLLNDLVQAQEPSDVTS